MSNTGASLIDSFIINGEYYHHFLFFNDDDRVELQDDIGNKMLTYDSRLSVFKPDGHVMGYIDYVSEYEWSFVSKDPMFTDRSLKEIHPEIILHLEVLVSKDYIAAINKK